MHIFIEIKTVNPMPMMREINNIQEILRMISSTEMKAKVTFSGEVLFDSKA